MTNRDIISLCARNLLRRRTRTILAIIGVVVGVCAIVVMLSIGFGLSKSYQDQIASYGNLHLIELYNYNSGSAAQTEGVINAKSLAEIADMEGVGAVTPIVSTNGTMYDLDSEKQTNVSVYGVDATVWEKFNYSLQEGSQLKKGDEMGVLFGNMIPNWFYDPNADVWEDSVLDVMNADLYFTMDNNYGYDYDFPSDYVRPDYPHYEVHAVGILANPNDESAYSVYMDINDVERIMAEAREAEEGTDYEGWYGEGSQGEGANKTYSRAYVYVDDITYTDKISEQLRDKGFQTYSSSDWLNQAQDTLRMIRLVLGGIGSISLFVAAIGITNTMIMSVYERTREIGVMKVIGANLKDIRKMFLLEAGMIGFVGGVAGILLSLGLSFAMNHFLVDFFSSVIGMGGSATVSVIPLWLIFASLGFSTLVGVAAGYSPANRAMKLSALESLKNE